MSYLNKCCTADVVGEQMNLNPILGKRFLKIRTAYFRFVYVHLLQRKSQAVINRAAGEKYWIQALL